MSERPHILIVDDEPNVRKVLAALLEQAGHSTAQAGTGEEALGLVRAEDPDLVLTDLKMPGMGGLDLLKSMRRQYPEIPVVLLTAHGTVETAVEAMKRGAHDFLTKPFEKEGVLRVIEKAVGQARRSRSEFQGPLAPDGRCGIVGRSAAIEAVRRLVERVAPSATTVLITGETGTGKELVAEALHNLSPRREAPMVRINCGAIPETLVEADLFGHERGAFTGADRGKPGRFELADGGTLFLDEVGELPPQIQVKLLRVLQDGRLDRVGGIKPVKVDARVVAATNLDLDLEVERGRFREDLLYRLRVVEIRVPPLRERAEDIAALLEFFLEKHALRLHRARPSVGPNVLPVLTARSWPGNVRELEGAVERALLLAETDVLGPGDFGEDPAAAGQIAGSGSGVKQAARAAADETARRMIRAALDASANNVTRAAERLGLSRRGLQMKMKELGLRP